MVDPSVTRCLPSLGRRTVRLLAFAALVGAWSDGTVAQARDRETDPSESGRATAYGPDSWRQLARAEADAMRVTHAGAAEALRNLKGLQPENYGQRRNPVPSVARELRRLRHVAPLLIERYLEVARPGDMDEELRRTLAAELLAEIGRSGHPASVFLLVEAVEQGCTCCSSCRLPIRALGDTASPEALPVLLAILDRARVDGGQEIQSAALRALGQLRLPGSWPSIEAAMSDPDPVIMKAAVESAGAFASRRLWPSDGDAHLRAAVGAALLDTLAHTDDEHIELAAMESIERAGTPDLLDALARRRAEHEAQPGETTRSATVNERYRAALVRLHRRLGETVEPH